MYIYTIILFLKVQKVNNALYPHFNILHSKGDPNKIPHFHILDFLNCPKIYKLIIPMHILQWNHSINVQYQDKDKFFVLGWEDDCCMEILHLHCMVSI